MLIGAVMFEDITSGRKRKSWSEISVLFVDWELLLGAVHSSTEQKTAEME